MLMVKQLKIEKYRSKDFDRNIIIDDRTKKVAQKVTEYLKKTDKIL